MMVENPTKRDVAEVEGALDDLNKLEGDIAAGMEELDRRTGVKVGVR